MYFLLSGEGSTDMGTGEEASPISEKDEFSFGPMAIIVARIVKPLEQESFLRDSCGFVSEKELGRQAKDLKPAKKSPRLRGKKRQQETLYFFENARTLACIAKQKATELKKDVVAVLFRDADGPASAGRGESHARRESMINGFKQEKFDHGVPMLPIPKSEAWLICLLKKDPNRDCGKLEQSSGNKNSKRPLKRELQKILNEDATRIKLNEMVSNLNLNVEQIDMPSFQTFHTDLKKVVSQLSGETPVVSKNRRAIRLRNPRGI